MLLPFALPPGLVLAGRLKLPVRRVWPGVPQRIPSGGFGELGFEEVLAEEFGANPGFGVLEDRAEGFALDLRWNGSSGEVEEGGGDVDVGDEGGDFGSGLEELGIAHQEGDTDGFVKGPAFVAEAVFAPELAVVGGEDEDGVVELVGLLERGEDFADAGRGWLCGRCRRRRVWCVVFR